MIRSKPGGLAFAIRAASARCVALASRDSAVRDAGLGIGGLAHRHRTGREQIAAAVHDARAQAERAVAALVAEQLGLELRPQLLGILVSTRLRLRIIAASWRTGSGWPLRSCANTVAAASPSGVPTRASASCIVAVDRRRRLGIGRARLRGCCVLRPAACALVVRAGSSRAAARPAAGCCWPAVAAAGRRCAGAARRGAGVALVAALLAAVAALLPLRLALVARVDLRHHRPVLVARLLILDTRRARSPAREVVAVDRLDSSCSSSRQRAGLDARLVA